MAANTDRDDHEQPRARAGHPSRVLLKLGSSDAAGTGLKTDSVVMTDNLATVLDTEIDRVIGNVPAAAMVGVDAALRHTLAL
ncbi:MAG TPA: type II toxin-antitoxin system PemK/MazF family toxin [Tepidisphaeraceae bacterium]